MISELPVEKLRKPLDPSILSCKSTEEMVGLKEILGQNRAVAALDFGLNIKEKGFNVYVSGAPGTGRSTAVTNFLDKLAKDKPVPSDWCYVDNFHDSYHPKALRLNPGMGKEFKKDVEAIVNEAKREIPQIFESKDYEERRREISKKFEDARRLAFSEVEEKAAAKGFLLQMTPMGPVFIPVKKGKPLTEEEFAQLQAETKKKLQEDQEDLTAELQDAVRGLRDEEKKLREEVVKLNKDVALYAIGHAVADLLTKYKDLPDVLTYLKEVQNDMVENLDQFRKKSEAQPQLPFALPWATEPSFRKYEVNVVVDNSHLKGAPVVVERSVNYNRLFGRLEKESQLGMLTTDFTMIIGGAIHRANGGYLVLQAEEVLRDVTIWNRLKSVIKEGKITIEEATEQFGFIAIKSLAPEPVPLDLKVVLIGDPYIYQLLLEYEREFTELFKVKAEFDTSMDRTEENVRNYAALVCTICDKEKLKHIDAAGLAKIIEYSSRLAEDQLKLSTRFAVVTDVLREANYYATKENAKLISPSHVQRALEQRIYRSSLIRDKIQEYISRGIFLIDTDGKAVGQINGLSVISLGDIEFGRPSRVTATAGLGRGGVVDIERRVNMGGPIHSKGVLILGGYLAQKYAQDKPLTLQARLVFEQSYEGVEGDSASSTELYAILSRLSDLPIRQDLAVTGSVNQNGEVQAIGGINEKIEGFFEVCKVKGFTGRQGIVMPESNVQDLMLKDEVVDAVKKGQFHIYAVKTIDEGIETLTGVKAGSKSPDGTFQKDTVNYLVDKRLREMAKTLASFTAPARGKKESS